MAQNCYNCKKTIGLFSVRNEIISGSGRLLCDSCYSGFGIYVNMLLDHTDLDGIDKAHSKAIESVKTSKLLLENQQKAIDDIEKLYKKKRDALRFQDVNIREDEQNNDAENNELPLNLEDEFIYSTASGKYLPYVVIQVTLKEKFWGTGSKNLTDLERVINHFAQKGYRLHTMSTLNSDSKGFGGGDRIQATLVFEKIDISPRP